MAKCPEICPLEHLFWYHISSLHKVMVDVMHSSQGNIEICSYNAVGELHPNSLPNHSPSEIWRIRSFSIRLGGRQNKCTKVMCTHNSNNYCAITTNLRAARDTEQSNRSNGAEINSKICCNSLEWRLLYRIFTHIKKILYPYTSVQCTTCVFADANEDFIIV